MLNLAVKRAMKELSIKIHSSVSLMAKTKYLEYLMVTASMDILFPVSRWELCLIISKIRKESNRNRLNHLPMKK
jgi:hypothetical protein